MAARSILEFILNYDFTQNVLSEATKWKRVAAAGGLSLASHKRLVKARVVKPLASKLAGIDRGSQNMLSKAQAMNRREVLDPKTGEKVIEQPRMQTKYNWKTKDDQPFTQWRSHSMQPFDNKSTTQMLSARDRDSSQTVSRHEADEVLAKEQMRKKYGDQTYNKYANVQDYNFKTKDGQDVCNHVNPHVVRKEGEVNKELLTQYPYLKNNKGLNIARQRQGLDTGEVEKYYEAPAKKINKEIDDVVAVRTKLVDKFDKKKTDEINRLDKTHRKLRDFHKQYDERKVKPLEYKRDKINNADYKTSNLKTDDKLDDDTFSLFKDFPKRKKTPTDLKLEKRRSVDPELDKKISHTLDKLNVKRQSVDDKLSSEYLRTTKMRMTLDRIGEKLNKKKKSFNDERNEFISNHGGVYKVN